MNLYYISFASETEFLGATVVEGLTPTQALAIATNNNLNPGGQAAILKVPEQLYDDPEILPLKYKLLDKKQMQELGSFVRHADMTETQQMAMQYYSKVIG